MFFGLKSHFKEGLISIFQSLYINTNRLMRKLGILIFLVTISTFFTFSTLQAQNEEEVLKKMLYDFTDTYSEYGKLKTNKEKVLAFVSKELSSTLVNYDVRDHVKITHSNFVGFSSYLDKMARAKDVVITYKVTDIIRSHVKGNIGVIVYVVESQVVKNGSPLNKGSETVTITFRKGEKSAWKIIHYTVIGIEDEKLKGACLCEFFSGSSDANSSHYVVKTTVPSGRAYSTTLNNFEFTRSAGDKIITVDKYTYYWTKNGEVYVEEAGKKSMIGKVTGVIEEDVIVLIIKKHLYQSNCTQVKVKK